MIKRFPIIEGVGTFSNFRSQKCGTDLSKNTIIYANNGYGKSTIATILKSAYLNDPQRIIARSTLTTQQQPIVQHIVIKVENGTLEFQDSKWSYNPPDAKSEILVFDQQYVYENLFIQKVESEHKQSIHKIIIGQEGVKISEDLTNAKAVEKSKKQLYDEYNKVLKAKKNNTGRNDYLSINDTEESNVIAKLQEVDKKLLVSREKDELSTLANFPILIKPDWNFSGFVSSMDIDFHGIHENARALVDEHIKNHLNKSDSSDGFIRQGLEQIVDTCPFCGQGLEGAEALIRAYQELYDQAHTQAIRKIKSEKDIWSKWDPSADILVLQSNYEKSYASLKKIEDRLSFNVSGEIPILDFETFRQYALKVKDQVLDSLSRKESNISQEISLHFLYEFERELKEINSQVDIAKNLYKNATQLTIDGLSAIDSQSIQALENQKNQLLELTKRFSLQEKTWCEEYKQLSEDLQGAEDRCRDLTIKLSEYSNEIFRKYQEDINKVLNGLMVGFKIENLVEQVDKRAKQPFAEFQIKINGLPVTLQEKEDSPCFQNTLSEGEKNTLSFAFFVTYLKQKGDLSNTIVVFDDPLSSMDDYRRGITANIIRDLAKDTKQMIVLTHKQDFLFLLSEKLEELQVLSLKKDNVHGSILIPFNVETERKSDHQKTIENFVKYLDDDFCDAKLIQGEIRLCLESALKFKYFRYLNGATTLGKICDELQKQNKLTPEIIHTLRDLNEVSCSVHHSEQGKDPKRTMDRAELLPYVRKTLDVIELI